VCVEWPTLCFTIRKMGWVEDAEDNIMQIKLALAPPKVHKSNNPKCPFCPAKKEKTFKTFSGKDNNSTDLKKNMLKPQRNSCAQDNGARPKDGKEGRQNEDTAKSEPSLTKKGLKYTFQAHHSISGNEIIKGEPIEKYLVKGGQIKKDTGYTINNCANGVFLPSYPKNYPGGWGKEKDEKKKLNIMKVAMDKHGQAHIGSHTGFNDENYPKHTDDYVKSVQRSLKAIKVNVDKWGDKCPWCKGPDKKPKKPFPPPYRLNGKLDSLSKKIEKHLESKSVGKWEFFISSYAHLYHMEKCRHRKKKSL